MLRANLSNTSRRILMIDRDAATHHEAGHAVIARALGVDVRCVEIGAALDDLGSCIHTIPAAADLDIMITMAGPLAESRYMGQPVDWIDWGHRDDATVRELLPRAERSREALEIKTAAMIDEHWRAIGFVADELSIIGRIDGAYLDELIAAAAFAARPGMLHDVKQLAAI
jgi:hypothetical protein